MPRVRWPSSARAASRPNSFLMIVAAVCRPAWTPAWGMPAASRIRAHSCQSRRGSTGDLVRNGDAAGLGHRQAR